MVFEEVSVSALIGEKTMIIRPVRIEDAEDFIGLSKAIDGSGFMLFEPGERKTTIEQQKKFFEKILAEKHSIFFVAESEGKLAGFIAALGSDLVRNRHSTTVVLGVHDIHISRSRHCIEIICATI